MDELDINLTIDNEEEIESAPDDILKLIKRIMNLRGLYDEAKLRKTELWKELQGLDAQLHARMEDSGIKSFRTDDYGLIYRSYQLWAEITDMEKAKEFFIEEGIEDEILQTVAKKGRLNDIVRKLVKEGMALPPGIDYRIRPIIGIRK